MNLKLPGSELDCKGKGYADDLHYIANPWEAFACTLPEAKSTAIVAVCGPDGMMHVASFAKDSLSNTVDNFKLSELSPNKCFVKDWIWVRYQNTAKKNGITDYSLSLDSSIYPAIKTADIPVSECRKESSTKINQIPCDTTIYFDQELLSRLTPNTHNKTTNTILEHPTIQTAQIGNTIPTYQILKDTQLLNNTHSTQCIQTTTPKTTPQTTTSNKITWSRKSKTPPHHNTNQIAPNTATTALNKGTVAKLDIGTISTNANKNTDTGPNMTMNILCILVATVAIISFTVGWLFEKACGNRVCNRKQTNNQTALQQQHMCTETLIEQPLNTNRHVKINQPLTR